VKEIDVACKMVQFLVGKETGCEEIKEVYKPLKTSKVSAMKVMQEIVVKKLSVGKRV
jgi:hypothetical protein